jgi:hypothetical protein
LAYKIAKLGDSNEEISKESGLTPTEIEKIKKNLYNF